jgi:Mg-chelatase subunit ChlD
MAARLRIARSDRSTYEDLAPDAPHSAEAHRRLEALIRRHLSPLTASLLAAPKPSDDGRFIEWYSDLAGQPVPLPSLPPRDAEKVRGLLQDRLHSLAVLAERLAAAGDTAAADALRSALSYPGEEAVIVVAGQPVLTFWGYRSRSPQPPLAATPPTASKAADATSAAGEPESVSPPGAAVAPEGPARWRVARVPLRSPWLWGALAVGLLGVLVWGYYRYTDLPWPPWGPDVTAMLADARSDEAKLREQLSSLGARLGEANATCRAGEALAAAQKEGQDLTERLSALSGRISADRELCPLREALNEAHRQEAAVTADLHRLDSEIDKRQKECQARAEAKRRADEAKRAATEQRRQEAAAERQKRQAEAEKAKQEPPKPAQEAAAQPPGAAAATKTDESLPPCPGQRPPEEAPDVAIVLDASGSMGLSASMSASQVQQFLSGLRGAGPLGAIIGGLGGLAMQQSSGPTRLDEAKKGINGVVRDLPNDVDIGLVTLEDCPFPRNRGFYKAAQRGALLQQVNGLRPMRGTPLARGLADAANMVDGVKADAIIVVISDGDDSCGDDPCATARAIKARKPRLKINVVDIGTGGTRCMAAATGGRVLTPGSGLDFENKIVNAAAEAMTPAHCR